MCRNTPKIYDRESEKNHKICTQVAVPLLIGTMYVWVTLEWPIRINLVAAFKIKIIWYVDFISNRIPGIVYLYYKSPKISAKKSSLYRRETMILRQKL